MRKDVFAQVPANKLIDLLFQDPPLWWKKLLQDSDLCFDIRNVDRIDVYFGGISYVMSLFYDESNKAFKVKIPPFYIDTSKYLSIRGYVRLFQCISVPEEFETYSVSEHEEGFKFQTLAPIAADILEPEEMVACLLDIKCRVLEYFRVFKTQYLNPQTVGGAVPTHEQAIDMGLSVKWAPWNVGASKPEDYGAYFAWGKINASKEDYHWHSYFYSAGPSIYNILFLKYDGSAKNEKLESSDDAATANWGVGWRMPTIEELKELMDENNCTWTWIDNHNDARLKGYEVKSKKTGALLFLPAAGYRWDYSLNYAGDHGYYWSPEPFSLSAYEAKYLGFDSSGRYVSSDDCFLGYSVRAVAVSSE